MDDLKVRSLLLFAWLAALTLAACGSSGAPAAAPSNAVSTAAPATLLTATKTVAGKSQLIVVDTKGMTLYYFTPDKGGTVTCTAACAQNWPPLKLTGAATPTGDKGVTGKVGTVANPEGATQVTYNGWPLYFYIKDKDKEDTYGQGVGGKWFVVPPDLSPAA